MYTFAQTIKDLQFLKAEYQLKAQSSQVESMEYEVKALELEEELELLQEIPEHKILNVQL